MGGRCFGFLLKCLIFLALLYGYVEVCAHCKIQICVEIKVKDFFRIFSVFFVFLRVITKCVFQDFLPPQNETHLKIFKEPQPSWN